MASLPAPNTLLRDLALPALCPSADEQLRRICAFLYVVGLPEVQTRALLAGYTPEMHAEGVYRASLVGGERSFGEWRRWRSLRPPRDPDLPDLVAELDRFVNRWRPRALSAAAEVADADDRDELEDYLGASFERPSRTWRAKAFVQGIEHLAEVPIPSYRATWAALVAEGIQTELTRFHEILKTVQDFLATTPLDADEIADIQAAREEGAASIDAWLTARRREFAGHFTEETLNLLALGKAVPPPLPDVPLSVLARFRPTARA
ncbi:hypothetical protein WME98_45615 [Sorangium sp. So ce296]|uniref:hypothetical protein n=1 Tax=Sorangium sp. So ce296 TaxID=3133296 RepID=UPI003F5E218A